MKALVLSDTHGAVSDTLEVLKRERPDVTFFLGDYVRDIEEVYKYSDCLTFITVRGNNDFFSDKPYTAEYVLDGKRYFATHSHLYKGKLELSLAASERKCDVVLYGHTHIPLLETVGDITLFNPGSLRYGGTYGIIEEGKPVLKKL